MVGLVLRDDLHWYCIINQLQNQDDISLDEKCIFQNYYICSVVGYIDSNKYPTLSWSFSFKELLPFKQEEGISVLFSSAKSKNNAPTHQTIVKPAFSLQLKPFSKYLE